MPKDICSPAEIAKWFINRPDREAGDDMTHLKLQKLIYFAQAWHLANLNKPLFQEDMQAWTHGPVVPSVWHQYKEHQWDSIPAGDDAEIDKNVAAYLDKIYGKYGSFTAKALGCSDKLTAWDSHWTANQIQRWLLEAGDGRRGFARRSMGKGEAVCAGRAQGQARPAQ